MLSDNETAHKVLLTAQSLFFRKLILEQIAERAEKAKAERVATEKEEAERVAAEEAEAGRFGAPPGVRVVRDASKRAGAAHI